MIISIIVVLLTATVIAISIKTETSFSLTRSIILGLTTAPFVLFRFSVDVIVFVANLGLKLGFALGGSNIEELMGSYFGEQVKKGNMVVRGDESEEKPDDEDLH